MTRILVVGNYIHHLHMSIVPTELGGRNFDLIIEVEVNETEHRVKAIVPYDSRVSDLERILDIAKAQLLRHVRSYMDDRSK